MAQPIFTECRRDLIAKTAADLLKILFAAALASRFFMGFSSRLKFILLLLSISFVIIGLFGCPLRKPEDG